MRYRLIPNSWSKASAKGLSILSIVGSSLAISQNYILPSGLQFQALETYDLKQVSVAKHIEYSIDQEGDEVRLSEPTILQVLAYSRYLQDKKTVLTRKAFLSFILSPPIMTLSYKTSACQPMANTM